MINNHGFCFLICAGDFWLSELFLSRYAILCYRQGNLHLRGQYMLHTVLLLVRAIYSAFSIPDAKSPRLFCESTQNKPLSGNNFVCW